MKYWLLLGLLCVASASEAAEPRAVALTLESKATLARVENYLTHLHSLSAAFTQSSPDGEVATGKFSCSVRAGFAWNTLLPPPFWS